jgi:hypothetical protein
MTLPATNEAVEPATLPVNQLPTEELHSVISVTVEPEPTSKSEGSSQSCLAISLVSGRDTATPAAPMAPTPLGPCSQGRGFESDSHLDKTEALSSTAEGSRRSGPGSTDPRRLLPQKTRERGVLAPLSSKGRQNPKLNGSDDAQLLDIQGAARFLGLTPWQVRGLLSGGELKCIRVGRKLYMRRAALIRWAENSEGKYTIA